MMVHPDESLEQRLSAISGVNGAALIANPRMILDQLLENESAFIKEQCSNRWLLPKGEGLTGLEERDALVRWVCEAARGAPLRLPTDTVCLAVALLDRLLTSTKVARRYAWCVGLACVYVAAKVGEEAERAPRAADVAKLADARYSAREIVRMERRLLDRLGFRLHLPTLAPFLHLMLAMSVPPEVLAEVVEGEALRRCVDAVLSNHRLSLVSGRRGFRPSLLALAVFSVLLADRPDCSRLALALAQLIKADEREMKRCGEAVDACLGRGAAEKENAEKSPRKRLRSKTDSVSSTHRRKTQPLQIDDLAESARMLYGTHDL